METGLNITRTIRALTSGNSLNGILPQEVLTRANEIQSRISPEEAKKFFKDFSQQRSLSASVSRFGNAKDVIANREQNKIFAAYSVLLALREKGFHEKAAELLFGLVDEVFKKEVR